MYAEPTMPKTSLTPLATSVSTNASDGVIFCLPVTAAGNSTGLFIAAPCDRLRTRVVKSFTAPARWQGRGSRNIAKRAANVYIRRGARPRTTRKTARRRMARPRAPAARAGPALDNSGRIDETTLARDPHGRVGRRASAVRQHVRADRRGTGQDAHPDRGSLRVDLLRAAEADGRSHRPDVGRAREDGIPARRRDRAARSRSSTRSTRASSKAATRGRTTGRARIRRPGCSPIRWRARASASTSCRTSRGSTRAAATTSIASSTRTC